MPEQSLEAQSAIRKMDEARQRLDREARDLHDSDDYRNQRDESRERYRRLIEKRDNLERVIRKLREARIVWGEPRGIEIGRADKRSDPPQITVNETYIGMRDAALAQVLAHEAIHLLAERENSIDQEILCRRKELEIWELLKGDGERHGLDLECENLQRAFAQGEDYVRAFLRTAYPDAPERDADAPRSPPPDPPRPRRRRKGVRIPRRGPSPQPGPWADYLRAAWRLVRHLFSHPLTEREYGFDIAWPAGYAAYESEGLFERFVALHGIGPARDARAMPAVFSVVERPDVVHGGAWASAEAWAAYRAAVWRAFGSRIPGAAARVLRDEGCTVGSLPGRCLEVEYPVLYRETEGEKGIVLARGKVCFVQSGDMLYSVSLLCEAADWDARAADLDAALESFYIRT